MTTSIDAQFVVNNNPWTYLFSGGLRILDFKNLFAWSKEIKLMFFEIPQPITNPTLVPKERLSQISMLKYALQAPRFEWSRVASSCSL